jgi:predicted NBD/HSP70 family sugar kinase
MSRDYNRVAVLRLIGGAGPIARVQIAERLGLSPATVTAVTRELLERGLVRVADHAPSKGGRPAVLLELVGGAATAFGVKIAPDHLVGVRVDLDAEVLERFEEPLDVTAVDAVGRIAEVLASWIGTSDSSSRLLGLGVGVPGVVDADRGLVNSPMLGWNELPLPRLLQDRLGVPVLADNDVNTLAVSERLYGRGRNVDDFLTVTVGRGIGLGIIAGGDIYRGFGGGAGEFGHITAKENGRPCRCGKRGCLETLVSDPALVTEGQRRKVLSRRAGIDRLRALADGGDATAQEIYGEAAAILGRSIADLVNVLSPQLVLISGEGTQAWRHLAAGFESSLRSHLFPPLRGVAVEVDPWDDAKWAVGAAALVLRPTFTPLVDDLDQDNSVNAWVRADSRVQEVSA